MNKALFLCLLTVFLFTSCDDGKNNLNNGETSGKINTVSVIIDDELWNGEIGDSLRNKFASPVLGLPQEEPILTINQFPVKLLEGFMYNSRNIIVVKKTSKSEYKLEENEVKNPQIVARFSGKTVQELIDSIQTNANSIVQKIKLSEIKLYQKQIQSQPLADSKLISNKFNVNLTIPAKYKVMLNVKNFIWMKKEITSGNLSIIAYELPFSSIKDNFNAVNRIIKVRDSIGFKYIHGSVPKTRMITEQAYAPFLDRIFVYGKFTFETKGNWELTHDFMGGPFLNYAIIDKENNRILILEGFCYAPSKQKRDLMFELEAIIKSVVFLKNK